MSQLTPEQEADPVFWRNETARMHKTADWWRERYWRMYRSMTAIGSDQEATADRLRELIKQAIIDDCNEAIRK